MVDITTWVKIESNNFRLKDVFEKIINSSEGFQLQSSSDIRRADLLIFELSEDVEKDFELIQSLINSDAVGEVFLTSEITDPKVLLKAIKIGAKEFLAQPLNEEEIRQALDGLNTRRERVAHNAAPRQGKIIDVIGSKGGVGSTTIAVNLAVSLADKKYGKSVALIDMNMLFGDIPLFLSLKPNYHWGEITKNIERLDPTFLTNILCRHSSGVHVLPAPGYLNGHPAATPKVMRPLLGIMQKMFDFVVIDGGLSINDTSLSVIEMSNSVLLVSLLNLACLSNTNKIIKSLTGLNYVSKERIKVLINRYLNDSDVSLDDAENGISQKIFWSIPNDYKLTMSAINQGAALSQIAEKTPIGKSLEQLAGVLMHDKEGEAHPRISDRKKSIKKGRVFSFLNF